MSLSFDEFVQQLESRDLVPARKLKELLARQETPLADAQALAKALIRQGLLTKFQATAAYNGRLKKLVLGDYVLFDKLGEGGMGVVYKARHRRMDRIVAIKMLPAAAMKKPALIERFYREVRAAARLSHPNIVTAYDAGEHDGTHYLVMEFIEGHDLAEIVREHGQMSVAQAVECILQAARGLEYAHQQNVVHRDIKPSNLILAISGQPSANLKSQISNLKSQISNLKSQIPNPKSQIPNRQSAIGNRQSAIGNREGARHGAGSFGRRPFQPTHSHRSTAVDRHRANHGHRRLHEPRTGRGYAACRSSLRCLQSGVYVVLVADRASSLRGRDDGQQDLGAS